MMRYLPSAYIVIPIVSMLMIYGSCDYEFIDLPRPNIQPAQCIELGLSGPSSVSTVYPEVDIAKTQKNDHCTFNAISCPTLNNPMAECVQVHHELSNPSTSGDAESICNITIFYKALEDSSSVLKILPQFLYDVNVDDAGKAPKMQQTMIVAILHDFDNSIKTIQMPSVDYVNKNISEWLPYDENLLPKNLKIMEIKLLSKLQTYQAPNLPAPNNVTRSKITMSISVQIPRLSCSR